MAEVTEREQKEGRGGPERRELARIAPRNRQEPAPSAFDTAPAERTS